MLVEDFLENLPQHFKRPFSSAYAVALAGPGVGTNKNYRLGCVVAKRRRVLSAGFNSYKTHPRLIRYTTYPFLHAEQAALMKYGLDSCKGMDIYVLRITRANQIAIAKPCEVCMRIIITYGINTIRYTTNTGYESL